MTLEKAGGCSRVIFAQSILLDIHVTLVFILCCSLIFCYRGICFSDLRDVWYFNWKFHDQSDSTKADGSIKYNLVSNEKGKNSFSFNQPLSGCFPKRKVFSIFFISFRMYWALSTKMKPRARLCWSGIKMSR